jgi:hypothetical protein
MISNHQNDFLTPSVVGLKIEKDELLSKDVKVGMDAINYCQVLILIFF